MINRREALLTLGVAAGIPRLLGLAPTDAASLGSTLAARIAGKAPVRSGPLGPFTALQNETVLTVAEHILPRTETPGARDARVNEFIAVIVAEWYDEAERARFLAGLDDLDGPARSRFGTAFLATPAPQQAGMLEAMDAEAARRREAKEETDDLFWPMMKSLTLYGYFTSRLVMTDVRRTPIIPGRFDGCVTES